MDVKCVLQEKVSEKTGKRYFVLFMPELEKTVFLEPAEIKILQLLGRIK